LKYLVIVERSDNNYSAYVPDLPGCVTTGDSIIEIEQNIKEAINGHLAIMKEFGEAPSETFHQIAIHSSEIVLLQVFIPELVTA